MCFFLLRESNKTFITLIPKCESPQTLSDYRPISLCNVIYKVASKVVVNRLKHIVPHIISDFQNAFIFGRLNYDNLVLHHEIIQIIKSYKSSLTRLASLKVHFSKVYDCINRTFLEAILHKIGLPSHFLRLIMQYVTTVSYSVLVNGSPTPIFYPSCRPFITLLIPFVCGSAI